MTRSRRHTIRRERSASQGPLTATPVPPAELLDCAAELKGLVDELVDLTGYARAWGMRVLRRNVELALLSPHTLESADNQLDFIEELAETVWDGGDGGFRQSLPPSSTPEETARREERRRAAVERLDEFAHRLCAAAEAWRDVVVATAEASRAGIANPQEDHSS